MRPLVGSALYTCSALKLPPKQFDGPLWGQLHLSI